MNHHKIIVMSKLLQRTCLSSLNYTAAAEIHTNNVTTTTKFNRRQRLSLSSSQIQSIPLRNSDSMTTAFACKRFYSKFSSQQHPTTSLGAVPPLCEEKAYELVLALKDAERSSLKMALDKYDALKLKEGFEVNIINMEEKGIYRGTHLYFDCCVRDEINIDTQRVLQKKKKKLH